MPNAIVNPTSLNMRDAPSLSAAVVAVLSQGQSVDPLSGNDDDSWLLSTAIVDGTTRIGWIRADLLRIGGSPPRTDIPVHDAESGSDDGTIVRPVGAPMPFKTKASESGNAKGRSQTSGLNGTEQKFDDGSSVIEAIENLSATRADGFNGSLMASCRRVSKGNVMTVEQKNYSYKDRQLPISMMFFNSDGIGSDVPDGFRATAPREVTASQFGKNDREDEGTGSPAMGLVQTNSEIFGASIRESKMAEHFGDNWSKNPLRLRTLIEVHSARTVRLVRVPLVDVGPGEGIPAEVDLSFACDQFLGTRGQGQVTYRLLIPA